MGRSDNLTLPYPDYRHFHHETHTFNQDMGKLIALFAGTPPLPALSPGQSANQTPQSSPDFRAKYKMHQTPSNLNNRPDLLENENLKKMQVGKNSGKIKFVSEKYIIQSHNLKLYSNCNFALLNCTVLYSVYVYQMKTDRWRYVS